MLAVHQIAVLIFAAVNLPVDGQLHSCQREEFQYAFTECDKFSGRYRVLVPKSPNSCRGSIGEPPIRVNSCYTSCEPGSFFNSTSLNCEKCKPGYYSLGGGIRLTSFNESTLENLGFVISNSKESGNCSGWQVRDRILENRQSASLTCSSIISYGVNIVKRGKIQFTYQFIPPQDPSIYVFFSFLHFNLKEKKANYFPWDERNSKDLPTTKKERWKTFTYEIFEPGYYTFVWKNLFFGNFRPQISLPMFYQRKKRAESKNSHKSIVANLENEYGTIKIRSIEISGVSYTSECSPCETGTFTDHKGAKRCLFCPKDTYAEAVGSVSCTPCLNSKFSFEGAEKCLDRPQCSQNDYFESVTPCDKQSRQRTRSYQWIEPKTCMELNLRLPASKKEPCDPYSQGEDSSSECSPGMELINGTCRICEQDYYNDGTLERCAKCPPTTSPSYSLVLNKWKHPTSIQERGPLLLSLQCLSKDSFDTDCEEKRNVWTFVPGSPSYIRSSNTVSPSFLLVLSLSVPGFHSTAGGKLSFRFELKCEEGDDCSLVLLCIKDIAEDQRFVVEEWDKTVSGIREHTLTFNENVTMALRWVFSRQFMQSHLRIYQITLTNTRYSGAIECESCPLNVESDCIPCPLGYYTDLADSVNDISEKSSLKIDQKKSVSVKESTINGNSSKCKKCPQNTIINQDLVFPIGLNDSCVPCGPGLVSSEDRSFCYNSCNLTLFGDHYNLSALHGQLVHKGDTLFSGDGVGYYHLFNLSLCGNEGVSCHNNLTDEEDFDSDSSVIQSLICRSTIVPARSISTQSVSLGDKILAITSETNHKNLSVHPEFNSSKTDIHIYLFAQQVTAFCSKGRFSIVTLRCQPDWERDFSIMTPKQCPDGTCDGCLFHFMVVTRTMAACRLCKENDYDVVITECIGGEQEIHYINAKSCILTSDGRTLIKRRSCSVIPKPVKVGIFIMSLTGMVLLVLVVHFWKVNRRLEYKYSKLVENKNTAESCAMDDEEEEEVRVRHRMNKDDSDYETIQLTKHSRDDIL